MLTNHRGVFLLHIMTISACVVPLPIYKTFEVLVVYLHRAGLNLLVCTVPVPLHSVVRFFYEFDRVLECAATFASPIFALGDINIHLDLMAEPSTTKFLSSLESHDLVQHVTGPKHTDGHTVDVLITCSDVRVYDTNREEPKL